MSNSARATFAVLDVETTGLFSNAHDRIIEIAVLTVNAKCEPLDEYCTLVNPDRDLGPVHLHGISAGEAMNAPRFPEIAGDVLAQLHGTVLAGHNIQFDHRFLKSEIARLGHMMPEIPFLCTMQLASLAAPELPRRRLSDCCSCFGIEMHRLHTALGDARATAQLLKALALKGGREVMELFREAISQASRVKEGSWPRITQTGKCLTRRAAGELFTRNQTYISKLVAALPAAGLADTRIDQYFSLLDRALEDRRVTHSEADQLLRLALEMGISRETAMNAHRTYLHDVVTVALRDGKITDLERDDLAQVSLLLSVPEGELESILAAARPQSSLGKAIQASSTEESLRGKRICFTGELAATVNGSPVTREMAEHYCAERGMVPRKSVTKDLDFLVLADPDSMSSKAKKARLQGVKLIAEPVFWKMLSIDTD